MGRLDELKAKARSEGWDRYIVSENDERALLEGCYVDERFGFYVCDYFKKRLTHAVGKWQGQPFVPLPWQATDIIMPLFSWLRADGRRRFREAGIWLPKGQGKTQLCAGLLLYGVDGDKEPGAECYSMANDREQASIMYRMAATMVRQNDYLRGVFKPIPSRKRLVYGNTAWVQALSQEAATQHGLAPHFFIVDELQAFNNEGRERLSANRYGGRKRDNPLAISISHAGAEEAGIGREEYERHKRISGGIDHDTSTFVYIREAEKGDDWRAPTTWAKANPMLGITIREEDMAMECRKASSSPSAKADFMRYCLNVWVGARQPWLDVAAWRAGRMEVNEATLKGLPCFGGMDLSEKIDLTAWVKCFALPDGRMLFVPTLWLPHDIIAEREAEDRAPYRAWAEAGWLRLTDGPTIDPDAVKETIIADCKKWNIKRVGYDKFGAFAIWNELQTKHGITMIEVPQTCLGMNEAAKEFESLVVGGKQANDGNPIMDRMVSQVQRFVDTNGNIRPIKRDNARRRMRIDGVVAAVMALRIAMTAPKTPKITQGIIWV